LRLCLCLRLSFVPGRKWVGPALRLRISRTSKRPVHHASGKKPARRILRIGPLKPLTDTARNQE
jgi:hypothetical protein